MQQNRPTTVKREMKNQKTRMIIYLIVGIVLIVGLSVAFSFTSLSLGIRIFLVSIITIVLISSSELLFWFVRRKKEKNGDGKKSEKFDPYK